MKYNRYEDLKLAVPFFYGKNNGGEYDNYEPFEGNYPDWALEAFQTLDR